MHFLYEEGGEVKAATLLGDAPAQADSWSVETPFGKRIKLRAKDVWLKFDQPAATVLLQEAQLLAKEIDMDLLWECAPNEEFKFEESAREYFGDKAQNIQLAAVAMALQGAPIYFRRKGKGNFQRAPEEQLHAALASVERKKAEALLQGEWESELLSGHLPDALAPLVSQLVFAPDKNSIHYKALHGACQQAGLSIPALLIKVGAIGSPIAVHQGRFLKEYFAKGIDFPTTAEISTQSWEKIATDLPEANVRAFSIDDATTTEIDDAFSVTAMGDGRYQVGIHIAAPALLISREDPLDQVARKRLSTVYFPGGKITMLPESVINVFSLAEGDDPAQPGKPISRPALSLYVTIDSDGNVCEDEADQPITKVERVPMAANLRLHAIEHLVTEEVLQSVLDTSSSVNPEIPFHQELALLWQAAKKIHANRQKRRVEHGLREERLGVSDPNALARDFHYEIKDATGHAVQGLVSEGLNFSDQELQVDISTRQRGSVIDTIVSEWMIYCNSTWGGLLAKQDVPAIYRAQQGWGAQRTRMQTTPCRHEGLGVENYAWCTSPLRRYADLVNQWQLIALAKHGVMAKLVAPFQPKDSDIMAIAADFDATYGAYGDHQSILEKYWCLRWVSQQGLPWRGFVRTMKEGQVRLEDVPLRLQIPELAQQGRGLRVEVEIIGIDLLELTASVRVIQIHESTSLTQQVNPSEELGEASESEAQAASQPEDQTQDVLPAGESGQVDVT